MNSRLLTMEEWKLIAAFIRNPNYSRFRLQLGDISRNAAWRRMKRWLIRAFDELGIETPSIDAYLALNGDRLHQAVVSKMRAAAGKRGGDRSVQVIPMNRGRKKYNVQRDAANNRLDS